MNEGKLNSSQRITLVTNNAKLLATGSGLENLANEQIGVFAQDGRSRFKSTTTPAAAKGRKFKIAQGFPQNYSDYAKRAQIPSWPHQSVEFTAGQISKWTGTKAKPFTKEPIVALGYDGVDDSKGLKVKKGENVKVHLHLTGGPISKLVPTTGWLHREYFIDVDCAPDSEPGDYQNQLKIQDKIIKAIQADKFGTIPLTNFVKVTGISSGATALSGLVGFTSYQVVLTDEGTDLSLGLVQAQYPTKIVKRVKRDGLLSTYQVTQLTSDAAPTAVSVSKFPVLPNCATCPSGYTLQAEGAVFEVTVSSTETPADQTGQISKTKIAQSAEQAVFQYVMPAATVPATFETNIKTGTADAEVVSLGKQQALCIPPSASTVAWASSGTANRAPKVYTITLADTVCGATRLPELQAAYGTGVSETVDGLCSRKYSLTVYSDTVVDEACGDEIYPFTAPAPFGSTAWETAAPTYTASAVAGVLFEGVRYVRPVDEHTYPYIGYDSKDFDPVTIRVSSFSHDYQGPVCQDPFPFTALQDADYPIGYGRDVIPLELDSLGYFLKGPYDFHPIVRQVFGSKFVTKPDQYYDEYQLEIRTSHKVDAWFDKKGFDITYRFYFPVGQGKEFERAINALVASADSGLAEVNL